MNKFNNPTGYVVIYKQDGLITEFQRTPKGLMQFHNHLKTANNARLKRGANDGWNEGWFVTTTVALSRARFAHVL